MAAAAARMQQQQQQLRQLYYSTTTAPYFQTSLQTPWNTTTSTTTTISLMSTASPLQQQQRTFWSSAARSTNTFTAAMRHLQLKRLEREANAVPDDPALQYRFLAELAQDYPEQVVARVSHPAFANYAVNREIAILYLQALQRSSSTSSTFGTGSTAAAASSKYLSMPDLLQRLMQSNAVSDQIAGITPERILEWKQDLQAQKLPKRDQVPYLLNLLVTGGSAATALPSATAAAAAAAGSPMLSSSSSSSSSMMNHHPPRGFDPKHPWHVQVSTGYAGARGAVLGFLARAGLVLVAFSAVGALLDERGIGRGLGGVTGGNSKHIQEATQDASKVRFSDVKGVEEAKAELEEIVLYLKDPSRFTRLGGKLPRGLLLTGPPGTGKTLLAKAIAGEAGVPFFYSSGSQFEEVYVGLGAKRIRELFEAAKQKAPAIIFIDEIDAVGGTRKLKDQSALKMTLNELLVQLDGFDENNGIIVIGATNFAESLDSALLRPGRFDKHVTVPLPDVGGRKEILEMYAKKTKLAKDVDMNVLARGTTGFSGADLFNLMNQAALKASVDGLNSITMAVLEYAKDKIIMGAERKSAVITAETARNTAYHEAGHAVVAVLTEGSQTIHKATIMPRGQSLGMVTTLPEGDQTSQSQKEMLAYIDMCMGGRVAEELVFGKDAVTSGASSDIQQATRMARAMVTKYGFSDEVGIVYHGGDTGEETASAETRALIDKEVKKMTDSAYKRAKDLLTKYSREHKLLAETMLEYETLTGDEVRDLVLHRIKPKRPVINKEGGSRGDQSIITGKKTGPKGRLFGKDSSS